MAEGATIDGMPTLEVDAVRSDGVTLVQLVVAADRPHRVRIESRLEGPIWPPLTDGKPAAGWDARGVSLTVEPGLTPLGFAAPGAPSATDLPIAEIVEFQPVSSRPGGVETWFQEIEARLAQAGDIESAGDLPSATAALAGVGGLAAVESLAAELERDARVLSRLSIAPEDLQSRTAAVEIPTSTFARVAGRSSR